LEPADGLKINHRRAQTIELVQRRPARGGAAWELVATKPQTLTLRRGSQTIEHPLIVGQRTYGPAVVDHAGQMRTMLPMRQVRLFEIVPGLPQWGLPAWLVGYLLLTLPFTLLLRRVLKIA
jgi:hypothetical protein